MGKSKKSERDGGKAGARASKSDPALSSETAASASKPALSFEVALEQLESTVARLEEGEMPLEEALELFENGVKLSRQCSTTLEAAEKRIEILVADRAAAEGADDAQEIRTEIFERDDFEDADAAGDDDD